MGRRQLAQLAGGQGAQLIGSEPRHLFSGQLDQVSCLHGVQLGAAQGLQLALGQCHNLICAEVLNAGGTQARSGFCVDGCNVSRFNGGHIGCHGIQLGG